LKCSTVSFNGQYQNIVFGERFDVLFVDGAVKPVIYLETKKPGRGLADLDEFKQRSQEYETLVWIVLTDGYKWLRVDSVRNEEQLFSSHERESASWQDFFRVFEVTACMKDVFDQWFDEERRKSAHVCYDKIFHEGSDIVVGLVQIVEGAINAICNS